MPAGVDKISDQDLRVLREWLRTFGQPKRWHVHQVKIALHSASRRARELARARCVLMYNEMMQTAAHVDPVHSDPDPRDALPSLRGGEERSSGVAGSERVLERKTA